MTQDPTELREDGRGDAFADGRRVPRMQLVAWRNALALAPTIAGVIDVVQRIADVLRVRAPALPSRWQPRRVHSREDVEHWARRLRSRPPARPGTDPLVPLAGLLRFAVERMNELGPRRAPGEQERP